MWWLLGSGGGDGGWRLLYDRLKVQGKNAEFGSLMGWLAECKLGRDIACTTVLLGVILENSSEEKCQRAELWQSTWTFRRAGRKIAQGENISETWIAANGLTNWPGA